MVSKEYIKGLDKLIEGYDALIKKSDDVVYFLTGIPIVVMVLGVIVVLYRAF